MSETHEKRELNTIAPEGLVGTIIDKIKNLASWPFKSMITTFLKEEVSQFVKDATLAILDDSEKKVIETLEKLGMKYAEFRNDIETNWDAYAENILARLGFVSVPQGDGPEMVEFRGFPVETEASSVSVVLSVILDIVIPILMNVIAEWWHSRK